MYLFSVQHWSLEFTVAQLNLYKPLWLSRTNAGRCCLRYDDLLPYCQSSSSIGNKTNGCICFELCKIFSHSVIACHLSCRIVQGVSFILFSLCSGQVGSLKSVFLIIKEELENNGLNLFWGLKIDTYSLIQVVWVNLFIINIVSFSR